MNGSIFFPKGNKAPQGQQSLARKNNKIGDETKHGHSNMINKYSYSFRVLTSTTHQTAFGVYFLEKLIKLSNNGAHTRYNFFLCLLNCSNFMSKHNSIQ